MNDRRPGNTKRSEWPVDSAAALRAEEQRVFAALMLYVALILFAIWGVKMLDRHIEGEAPSSAAGVST